MPPTYRAGVTFAGLHWCVDRRHMGVESCLTEQEAP